MITRRRLFLGAVGGGAAVAALGGGGLVALDASPAAQRWVMHVVRAHLAEGGLVAVELDRFARDFLEVEGTWKLELFAVASPVLGVAAPLKARLERRIAEKKRQVISYFVLSSDLFAPQRSGPRVRYLGLAEDVCQGANPFAQPVATA